MTDLDARRGAGSCVASNSRQLQLEQAGARCMGEADPQLQGSESTCPHPKPNLAVRCNKGNNCQIQKIQAHLEQQKLRF